MFRLGRRFVSRNMDDVFELTQSAMESTLSLASSAGRPVVRAVHSRNLSLLRDRRALAAIGGGSMNRLGVQTRALSEAKVEEAGGEEKKNHTSLAQYDYDDYDDYEEPTTAGGKVAMWTRLMLQLALLSAFAGCTYVTVQELFPGRMSPNRIYSDAFELLKGNAELQRMIGEDMTAFGRSAGRRHFDSRTFVDDYGANRTRIRFNIRGSRGQVMVWSEMADSFVDSTDEFSYLIVQDRRSGRVLTVQDNRSKLDEMAQTGQLVINETVLGKAQKMITGLMGGGGADDAPPAHPAA
jgi:hypothetical protein